MDQAANWQHNTVSTQVLSLFQINLLSRLMAWKLSLHNSCSVQASVVYFLATTVSLLQRKEILQERRLIVPFKVAETVLHMPWAIKKRTLQ